MRPYYLLPIPFLGGLLLFYTTIWGVGTTTDSLAYINMAREFLGTGISSAHFPPLYPMLLSISRLINIDPLEGARWIQILLFIITIALIGWILYKETNWLFSILGMLLILSAPSVLVYSFAWSEGLFILLIILSIAMFKDHVYDSNLLFLILIGLILSCAIMTRYVGISMILTICLYHTMHTKSTNLLERLIDSAIFIYIMILLTSMFSITAWTLMQHSTGAIADRTFSYHPITWQHLESAINTYSNWFGLPITGILIAMAFIYSVVKSRSYYSTMAIMFILTYLATLTISISFFDAHTPMDNRILFPMYPVLLIGVIGSLWKMTQSHKLGRIALTFTIIVIVLSQVPQTVQTVQALHNDGGGFSNKLWKKSELISMIPKDKIIYTNGPEAIKLFCASDSLMLPVKLEPGTKKNNENFKEEFDTMIQDVKQGKAIIVYFSMITWRWYLPTKEEIYTNLKNVAYQNWDGTMWKENK